ncbi:hypothetical protein [Frankia sp. CiP3]|uniref:hypothetical protein n=1 Tax=Frankia sp. CiP3 TaxID=2880971 RepID=UPI0035B018A6
MEIGAVGELAGYPPVPVGGAVLAERVGERPETVQALMGPLVVEGLVEQRGGGYRLTALGRAPSAAGVLSPSGAGEGA